jgi:alkylation response protein AidB-like acyl-CoA dehydrogenase
VDFAFSEEQEELRRTIRRFFSEHSPISEVRRLMETEDGYNPEQWAQLADPLGLQALTVPEEYGGQGFGSLELTVVLEEMGRSLVCAPYFATVVLAANALLASDDDDAKRELLPSIASGETIATLAFTEDNGRWDESGVEMRAVESGGTWRLDGHKMYVLDGHIASLVLVVARTQNGLSLFGVDGSAEGLARSPFQTMDLTRRQARLEFSATPARLIGPEGGAGGILTRTLDLAAVALAAEQVGGAQRCLEMSVEYAKNRFQFGRPIGSFQAIKHKCADVLLEIESAKSAAYYASWAADEDADDLPLVASMAKAYCSESYFHAAAENIQIHGGIGFTWDDDAHLYFKRAASSGLLFGDAAYHRERLLQHAQL